MSELQDIDELCAVEGPGDEAYGGSGGGGGRLEIVSGDGGGGEDAEGSVASTSMRPVGC